MFTPPSLPNLVLTKYFMSLISVAVHCMDNSNYPMLLISIQYGIYLELKVILCLELITANECKTDPLPPAGIL